MIKTKISRLIAATIGSLIFGSCTVGLANDIELNLRYWKPTLAADVKNGAVIGNIRIPSVDIKNELGVQDKNITQFSLAWNHSRDNRLQLDYDNSTFYGDIYRTSTITIFGRVFSKDARFITNVDTKNTRLVWTHYYNDPVDRDETKLGIMYGISHVKIDAVSTSTILPTPNTKNFNVLFPTIGASAEFGLSQPVSSFFSISGAYAGSKGHVYNAEMGLKAKLGSKKQTELMVGYRLLKINVKNSADEELDTQLKGPFFAATYRF